MRNRRLWAVIVLVGLSVTAVGIAARSSKDEPDQTTPPNPDDIKMKVFINDPYFIKIDTSSENWRQLTDELGIMLFVDRMGLQRGTLYVKSGESWIPVALQGAEDLGPDTIPLSYR